MNEGVFGVLLSSGSPERSHDSSSQNTAGTKPCRLAA